VGSGCGPGTVSPLPPGWTASQPGAAKGYSTCNGMRFPPGKDGSLKRFTTQLRHCRSRATRHRRGASAVFGTVCLIHGNRRAFRHCVTSIQRAARVAQLFPIYDSDGSGMALRVGRRTSIRYLMRADFDSARPRSKAGCSKHADSALRASLLSFRSPEACQMPDRRHHASGTTTVGPSSMTLPCAALHLLRNLKLSCKFNICQLGS
jgi:hypothetical protein